LPGSWAKHRQIAIFAYNGAMMRRFAFLIIVFLAVATPAAAQSTPEEDPANKICAPNTSTTPQATPVVEPEQTVDVAELEFDLIFLEAMIPHVKSAIEMAVVAGDNSQHAEIDQFAQETIEAQQLQAETMRTWRADWYPDVPVLTQQQLVEAMIVKLSDSPGVGGVAGLEEMNESHRQADLAALCASGDEIDITYIDTMIAHNSSAIVLAKEAQNRSTHREIKEMAASIVTAQQYQIDQLLAWRESWFPDTPIGDNHGA
jgi:uncharacterized protein (DUF305 family)